MKCIGLMSGTSMDGIDAALLETDGESNLKNNLGHTSISYDPLFKILLKVAEYSVRKHLGDLEKVKLHFTEDLRRHLKDNLKMQEVNIDAKIKELSSYLHGKEKTHQLITFDEIVQHSTELHAQTVKKLLQEKGLQAHEIDVVGYHGQTLFHRPSVGVSVIVGSGQYLADTIGITVINDFRANDVAHKGQGAPFAPLYHYILAVLDKKILVAVVNCGGIANVTFIPNPDVARLKGFDIGTGNGLIDHLVRQRTSGAESMDKDGQYGKNGKVHENILAVLKEKAIIKEGKNYFSLLPPKSLDINDMQLIAELDELSLEDACATLEAFTADSIVRSLEFLNAPNEPRTEPPRCWILSGGGWKNPVIRRELEMRLKEKLGDSVEILTADEAGWNSQAMEAEIFAYLAVRSLKNLPISVPGTTGVPKPLSGGHAHLPRHARPTLEITALLDKNPEVLRGYKNISVLSSARHSFLRPENRFYEVCQKIESDPNFRPMTLSIAEVNKELLNRVVDVKGKPLHDDYTTALAIQPSSLKNELNFSGQIYQIRIALFSDIDNDEIPIWHIDTHKVIVVNTFGETSIHWRMHVEEKDFTQPIRDKTLDHYLKNENPPLPHPMLGQIKNPVL